MQKYLISHKYKGRGAWYSNKNSVSDRGYTETMAQVNRLFNNSAVEEVRIKRERIKRERP